MTREALDFSGADDGRPVELSLAVMGEKNLMAVVKLRRDHEYDFYCLTFIGRPKNDAASTDFKFFQAKFHSTPHNFKILGISGKHAEGSALVVLGKIPDPSVPTTGLIYFSGCPWPPSDGLLLPFQATPQTADSDDR
ncbi:MAG TPA: hypothetical protein VG125_03375 [Pirellulales bacterium]|nr:hypothetical protein [Pirellulales bacterium]